jgi:hypothetical protein
VLLRESLIGHTNLQEVTGQLACLVGMARCALEDGDAQWAVMLCALVERHRREKGLKLHELDEAAFEAVLKQCRRQLGKARHDPWWKEGEALKLDVTLLKLMER